MKIGIVADDLTGANATGVLLTKQGFTSATVIQTEEIIDADDLDALCIDTDSRYADDGFIIDKVTKAMKHFDAWGAKVICKRIDSTIRGNIGLEIDTVLQEMGEDSVAIVVGAFPDSGRISSGGYLLVNGIPVEETDVARDPLKPITESYIPGIIGKQSKLEVGYVGLDMVLDGSRQIKAAIKEQISIGKRIIVIDAVTDDQIETIAYALAKITDVDLVPVDPGPLTAAYATAYFNQLVAPKKIIVTVGSVTSLARRQLRYLQEKMGAKPVYVDAEKLAVFSDWQAEVDHATKEALERMDNQDVLVVTTKVEMGNLVDLTSLAAKQGTTQSQLAKKITDGLATITRNVMEATHYEIQGCYTSGGDVTASLCAVTNATGIKLADEVFPLTAFGTLMGGDFADQPIITKGGLIGDDKAIYACVKYLRAQHSKKQTI
jgi:uncharacterized protein YgbK (DUF1537 family)